MNNNPAADQKLKVLLAQGHWTDQEKQWMLSYLEKTEALELKAILQAEFDNPAAPTTDADPSAILAAINKRIDSSKQAGVQRMVRYRWVGVAAAILLMITGGYSIFYNKEQRQTAYTNTKAAEAAVDKDPGTEQAVLTLGDGSRITLNADERRVLAMQDGQTIASDKGVVAYDGQPAGSVVHNVITTSRGNQFSVKLSDGTRVWLNAASSIRYPTVFSSSERVVEITGEVYFEVAQDKSHPFIVKIHSGGKVAGEVKVLGTQFNINAYDDEHTVKTTLAEGKVQVSNASSTLALLPSEQAVLTKPTSGLKSRKVNIEKELAWHSGMFEFEDDDVATIMRQIARWYDVDISFNGAVPRQRFSGSIRRQATLNQVFQILKFSGISCSYNGRFVTVSSK
ncbi:FecR family protein [Niabella ginsengisoli]|uniref:FecR domain-containing protein n=1 Tax=Niabella ginsengisoli TaxID=522298 RepID=A0ABS9SJ83_9BACT|nr:FecR domain-containing protein [Niabella ginsengisoli]MCH5598391.1 FecR domain-containing protein [Niabella ginsengisoli]